MNEKKKYPGVYQNEKTGLYDVITRLKTKDSIFVSVCKRGFPTAKRGNEFKQEEKIRLGQTTYDEYQNNRKGFECIADAYLKICASQMKIQSYLSVEGIFNKYIDPFFGDKDVNKLTSPLFAKFKQSLATNVLIKNSRKNRVLSVMKSALEHAELIGIIEYDTLRSARQNFGDFSMKDYVEKQVDFYEKKDVELFLDTFEEYDKYKLLFEVLLNTGMRSGEIRALKVGDLDHDRKGLLINKQVTNRTGKGRWEILPYTKTNKPRFNALSQKVYDNLVDHIFRNQLHKEDFLFFGNTSSSPMSTHAISNIQNKHAQLAGIRNIRFHDFRHTHTVLLKDANVDSKVVADRLGHSNINTTNNIYDHVSDKRSQQLMDALDTLYS